MIIIEMGWLIGMQMKAMVKGVLLTKHKGRTKIQSRASTEPQFLTFSLTNPSFCKQDLNLDPSYFLVLLLPPPSRAYTCTDRCIRRAATDVPWLRMGRHRFQFCINSGEINTKFNKWSSLNDV